MTLKEAYRNLLIELNKENVESILLEAFNYFWRKAEIQYCNKWYNLYNMNQQTDDNLRVLKKHSIASLTKSSAYGDATTGIYSNIYETTLGINYLHILSCIVEYDVTSSMFNCEETGNILQFNARRLVSNSWGGINENYYQQPKFNKPYYYIHDYNDNGRIGIIGLETNEIRNINDLTSAIQLEQNFLSTAENVRIEIRCGRKIPQGVNPSKIYVEYLEHPKLKILTQEDLDLVHDTTIQLEYPEYVCYEIINELVKLFLENTMNPRLNTNVPINNTIGTPIQTNTK